MNASTSSLPSPTPSKQRVAEGFLMSSCPGQFQHVLDDLRKLLPPAVLTETFVQAVAKAYHSQHGKLVTVDGAKVLLHKLGEVDDRGYLDPHSKHILVVDGMAGEVQFGMTLPPAALEPARLALEQAAASYIATHYATETAASAVYAWERSLHVVMYGERLNLHNFWSGSWLSVWELNTEKQLLGTIKLRAHYFEEGNVQMQTTKTLPPTPLPSTHTDDEATATMAAIEQAEATVQRGLEAMYCKLGDDGFRSLRRKLPQSKVRMNWSNAAHNLSRTLNNSTAGLKS